MELNVRDLSETVAELTIEQNAEKVQREFNKKYNELQKEMHMPGFRKGKVPRAVLQRRFGQDVQGEVAREMANSLLEEALTQRGLRPVGEPQVESLKIEEGKPFQIVVRVEHIPELKLGRYRGLAPQPAELEVDAAEVEKQLRAMQLRDAKRTEADRPVQEGDSVEGRYRLFVNDVLDGNSDELDKRLDAIVGEDNLFTGTKLDRQLIGKNKGERFRIEAETPLAYAVEKYRAKRVALDVELDKIEQLEVATLDDEFAQQRFQKSLADVREELGNQMTERKRREDRDQRLEVVFEKLLSENHIPVPAALVQAETAREEEQWNKYNVTEAERASLREAQAERIGRRVKNALILQRIIEQERMEVTDADYRKRYEALAPLYGKDPATVQQFYQSQPRLQQSLRNDILENKAIDLLLDSNPSLIVEV